MNLTLVESVISGIWRGDILSVDSNPLGPFVLPSNEFVLSQVWLASYLEKRQNFTSLLSPPFWNLHCGFICMYNISGWEMISSNLNLNRTLEFPSQHLSTLSCSSLDLAFHWLSPSMSNSLIKVSVILLDFTWSLALLYPLWEWDFFILAWRKISNPSVLL